MRAEVCQPWVALSSIGQKNTRSTSSTFGAGEPKVALRRQCEPVIILVLLWFRGVSVCSTPPLSFNEFFVVVPIYQSKQYLELVVGVVAELLYV